MLHVNNPMNNDANKIETVPSTNDCKIELQVASGWLVSGLYRNQTLKKVILQKTDSQEE